MLARAVRAVRTGLGRNRAVLVAVQARNHLVAAQSAIAQFAQVVAHIAAAVVPVDTVPVQTVDSVRSCVLLFRVECCLCLLLVWNSSRNINVCHCREYSTYDRRAVCFCGNRSI